MTEKIKIGVITGAHGVAGQVKIRAFTEDPLNLTAYGPLTDAAGAPVHLKILRATPDGCLIATLQNVQDRNTAEACKGKELYVSALPPADDGSYYTSQLIGLKAVDAEGKEVARVESVQNYGAGDLLELRFADGKTELFPFREPFFGEVDLKAETIRLNLPEVAE